MVNNPITKIGNFKKIQMLFDKNSNKRWEEWLKFENIFKPGKQGIVGLFSVIGDEELKIVFKLSQYVNYLVLHENIISTGLKEIEPFCPHFYKNFGTINCKVNTFDKNIFNPDAKHKISTDILMLEYIEKSCKFYNYIKAVEKVEEDLLYSIIKQVLIGIQMAQTFKKFTHYDLHSCNIMIKTCSKDVVFFYILNETDRFLVPTFGNYPIIIDYGFSYISDLEDGPLWPSLGHTNVGFTSNKFDHIADIKLFLSSCSYEIKEKRKSEKSLKFRKFVKTILKPLNMDFYCGWDDIKGNSAAGRVMKKLKDYGGKSKLFYDYENYCSDIIQSLIILPLQAQDYSDLETSYESFINEWIKIENEVSVVFYNLQILKIVVDLARKYHYSYLQENKKETAAMFRNDVHHEISKIVKFFSPKKINYEILLCSLLVFSRCMEGLLYETLNKQEIIKEKEYEKLSFKSASQVFSMIEEKFPFEYIFSKDTRILIFDAILKKTKIISLTEKMAENINSNPLKEKYINEIYSQL